MTRRPSDVSTLRVGILGGTGALGRGLAYRLGHAGQRVIIGSRDAARGAKIAAALAAMPGLLSGVQGGSNREAAGADLVIAALPYTQDRAAALVDLRSRLAGRIVIDCANAIVMGPDGPYALAVPEGSPAQQTAVLLPESRVAAAFQHVSAALLAEPVPSLGTDVLVLADDPATAVAVRALAGRAGMRGIFAGPLANGPLLAQIAVDLMALSYRRWISRSAPPSCADTHT